MEKSSSFLKSLLAIDFNGEFAEIVFSGKQKFMMNFVDDMCMEILENMEFDLVIKKLAVQFYYQCQDKHIGYGHEDLLYTYLLKNINILSSS